MAGALQHNDNMDSSNRPKSPHRQNGFNVHNSPMLSTESNPNQQYLSRSKTAATGSTVTLKEHAMGTSANHKVNGTNVSGGGDSDVEMDGVEKVSQSDVVMFHTCIQAHRELLRATVSLCKASATPSIQPLPIPKSTDASATRTAIKGSSQTPSDVATPPDAQLSASGRSASAKPSSGQSLGVRLPSIHALSPGLSTSQGTSSAQWSPGRSSDPHLYSISSSHIGSYPYSSVRPYLSTSFQTSAERSGFSRMEESKTRQEEEDEHDEDVFGNTSSVLGLRSTPSYQGRSRGRGEDNEGQGDSSGVFSFSSPYLRSQAMGDDVPGMPPSPPEANGSDRQGGTPASASGASASRPDRVLSPSWTARSLQQLSLGGGVEMTASSSVGSASGSSLVGARRNERSSRPSHMHHPHSYTHSHSAFSRSLPSGPVNTPQGRRLSSGRLVRPSIGPASTSAYSVSPGGGVAYGSATLFSRSPSSNSPYGRSPGAGTALGSSVRASPYHAAASGRVPTTFAMDMPSHRERSRSRQRWAVPRGPPSTQVYEDEDDEDDDDETDDEMMIPGQADMEDDERRTARPRESHLLAAAAAAAASRSAGMPGYSVPQPMPGHPVPVGGSFQSAAPVIRSSGMEINDDGTGPPPDEMTEVAAIRDRLGGAANCAAFIAKLWFLVTRPGRYGRFLHWNASGNTVILSTDPDLSNEFAADVLPRLWNHANYSSFIRQMNLYGFQRLPSSRILEKAEIQAAVEKGIKGPDGQSPTELSTAQQLYGSHSSFLHPKFVQGREDLLPLLKPRNAKKPKANSGGDKKDEDD